MPKVPHRPSEHHIVRCIISLTTVSGSLLETKVIDLFYLPQHVTEGWSLVCIDPEDEAAIEEINDAYESE